MTARARSLGWVAFAALVVLVVTSFAVSRSLPGKDVAGGLSSLGAPLPPSVAHWLGTDFLGRDVALRLLAGLQLSLAVGIGATLVALVIGTTVGLAAGMGERRTDTVLMRVVDLVMGFPFLLLCLAAVALLRQSGFGALALVLVLGGVAWTRVARAVRAKVMVLRQMDFVAAAYAVGSGHARVLLRHLVPNLWGLLLALGALSVAEMILAEATLSYLGLGPPPPSPSWGRMLAEGQPYLQGAPWLVFAPGLALFVTVLAFLVAGERLRHAR